MSTADGRNIPVILHSISNEHKIPEEMYMIPSTWKRFQLSQLINNLLENVSAVPFDFFIGEDSAGGKLTSVLSNHSNGEETLHLSYVPSILPPKHLSTYEHDDWVSSVSINRTAHNEHKFLTTSYDGVASVWNSRSEKTVELLGHVGPVLAGEWVGNAVVTGGRDCTVRMWDIDAGKPSQTLQCTAHAAPVSALAVAPPLLPSEPHTLLSSDWDGLVCLWDTRTPSAHEVDADPEEPVKKRRKSKPAAVEAVRKAPIHRLRGHTGAVNGVSFAKEDQTRAYSAGADHTLRLWDVGVGLESDSRVAASALRCVDSLNLHGVAVSGHVDRSVCVWDTRSSSTSNVAQKLWGHGSVVESVASHPHSPHHLASAALDGNVKLWDVRSPKQALFTVVRNPANGKTEKQNKILGVDWDGGLLASGGEDCAMQLHEARA
ncbi:hypothetical protein E3P92_03502 [Wallemia ichthyophaga]|uniref:Ribosome biogenesis protein YTM1 n=2 Tax=Wallemia ichthyophaga TaxID=245174 RepID=A0A4T0K270_WALIC|nr:Ribosome biosis protein YTM1 [Wallemia ichthyophaga EXF-994]TIA69635.1 hypothetical protein E3P91_03506 [Wallemia ichthyophaga]EOR00459.1 Ribosome biosis protein YTM1 [Wallemia ichthyophaga EXF-994]TIA79167.1 hypothetical protein E3P98_03461 [Wallemia ichthyophaga]TIA88245.1 hypothetical protein E3P97_03612 [Wallemia ichthyophaga]TIA96055.1 hypothetical protein E3P95_03433 [Wallemia ichthyophaga]